jgi:hypothetical protein
MNTPIFAPALPVRDITKAKEKTGDGVVENVLDRSIQGFIMNEHSFV